MPNSFSCCSKVLFLWILNTTELILFCITEIGCIVSPIQPCNFHINQYIFCWFTCYFHNLGGVGFEPTTLSFVTLTLKATSYIDENIRFISTHSSIINFFQKKRESFSKVLFYCLYQRIFHLPFFKKDFRLVKNFRKLCYEHSQVVYSWYEHIIELYSNLDVTKILVFLWYLLIGQAYMWQKNASLYELKISFIQSWDYRLWICCVHTMYLLLLVFRTSLDCVIWTPNSLSLYSQQLFKCLAMAFFLLSSMIITILYIFL